MTPISFRTSGYIKWNLVIESHQFTQ
jgi:hypothetical protein